MKDFIGNIVEVQDKVIFTTNNELCPLKEGTVIKIIDNSKVRISYDEGKEIIKYFNEIITISYTVDIDDEHIYKTNYNKYLVESFNNLNVEDKIDFIKNMNCDNVYNKYINDFKSNTIKNFDKAHDFIFNNVNKLKEKLNKS